MFVNKYRILLDAVYSPENSILDYRLSKYAENPLSGNSDGAPGAGSFEGFVHYLFTFSFYILEYPHGRTISIWLQADHKPSFFHKH